MSTLQQGRRGEAAIAAHFVKQGYDIYMPTFGNACADMIICKDGKIQRVEVKTTANETPSGKYLVALRSIRPNRTGNTIHKFDSAKSDLLAVFVEPEDRVVVLSSTDLDGRSSVTV